MLTDKDGECQKWLTPSPVPKINIKELVTYEELSYQL